MSIIEQAARRLEELRRGGIEIPSLNEPNGAAAAAGLPARVAQLIEEGRRPAAAPPDAGDTRTPHSREVEIDLDRLAAMGYITPETPRAQIADEFRVIKRPLLNNVKGKSAAPVEHANLIMVTSSVAGEGKTFVAVNLAISMAMEMDKTVLLVDADVARPSVLTRLALPPSPGLLDVLAGQCGDLADVMLRTNIKKLRLLPAGTPRSQATELLASGNMAALLAELSSRYPDRIIVFDAPPLLPSPESRVLATHMGQVLLVVESERTQQKTVAQALVTVEQCPVVMLMLNKASRSEVGFYYGYYSPTER